MAIIKPGQYLVAVDDDDIVTGPFRTEKKARQYAAMLNEMSGNDVRVLLFHDSPTALLQEITGDPNLEVEG
jgi:hypothetical protein